jgi:hypothetical protein
VEYGLDVEEINSRRERGEGEDEVWSQLIVREPLPDVELLTAARGQGCGISTTTHRKNHTL